MARFPASFEESTGGGIDRRLRKRVESSRPDNPAPPTTRFIPLTHGDEIRVAIVKVPEVGSIRHFRYRPPQECRPELYWNCDRVPEVLLEE